MRVIKSQSYFATRLARKPVPQVKCIVIIANWHAGNQGGILALIDAGIDARMIIPIYSKNTVKKRYRNGLIKNTDN